jgi:S-adenosylmethionine:tRNA ribosyltransferase-isomerase
MVVNDTKVFPARLYGNKEKTGAKIEVFLLRELNKEMHLWDVLVDPARKIRVGNKLYFGEGDLVAEVIDNTTSRGRTIRFLYDSEDDEFYNLIDSLGETPLPRYINRPVEPEDRERYQTIYARHVGAVAAPTAGIHETYGNQRGGYRTHYTPHRTGEFQAGGCGRPDQTQNGF